MSFYPKFQDVEPSVTSTTTGGLLKTSDPVLVFSGNRSAPGQATVGTISTFWPTSTSSSTATNISPTGLFQLQAASTSANATFLLSTATAVGQCVEIFYQSTSSSTQNQVTTASTANMTIASTDAQLGMTITFSGVPRAYVQLTAANASTAVTGNASPNSVQWLMTGRSSAGVVCT